MNVKAKLEKALQDAMTEVQVYDYELVNKRYLKPDEAQWRVEALIRTKRRVERIARRLGIPNPLKQETTVPSRPVTLLDPITDADLPF